MKNPVVNGWYADPESRVYGDTVYMYVTKSLPFEEQKNLDLVYTKDLKTYHICHDILDMPSFVGATFAIWAPTVVEKEGKYYLIFAANNIMTEEQVGGLYIGVSDTPMGPFTNLLPSKGPLLNAIYNHAQPIDAHLFKDEDGSIYLYYGGWGHMMVCKMREDMMGFETISAPAYDGIARELTPADYVEAPYVMKLDGKYHLMYSTGKWGNGTYRVKAAVSNHPMSEFTYYGDILWASELADGPGHNSAFCFNNQWYVAYHRRTIGDADRHHRRLCVDILPIQNGRLTPVIMTE